MYAEHALRLLDETGTDWCVLSPTARPQAWRCCSPPSIVRADRAARCSCHPCRRCGRSIPERAEFSFAICRLDTEEGWAKQNRHYWERDFRGYLSSSSAAAIREPHSTKQIEDAAPAGGSTARRESLALTMDAPGLDSGTTYELLGRVRCPLLVMQPSDDNLVSDRPRGAFAAATGRRASSSWRTSGTARTRAIPCVSTWSHASSPSAPDDSRRGPEWARRRAPHEARAEIRPVPDRPFATRARRGRGAGSWRARAPGLVIDCPGSGHAGAGGPRRVSNPLSAALANESRHDRGPAVRPRAEVVFEAWRRMDEILLANFMVFHDLVQAEWTRGSGRGLGSRLLPAREPGAEDRRVPAHRLPLGWLPGCPRAAPKEARLTADYNAEMLEHIARFPRVRDRAVFVGSPEDVVPDRFGEGLPAIRPWVEEHFDFSGYVLAPDAGRPVERETAEPLCIVTVGGSGVGSSLLRRAVEALPELRRRVAGLRMVVVCGPCIDPDEFPACAKLRPYVHDLAQHLAADVALVQGGLTTCMLDSGGHRRSSTVSPAATSSRTSTCAMPRVRFQATTTAWLETDASCLTRPAQDGWRCASTVTPALSGPWVARGGAASNQPPGRRMSVSCDKAVTNAGRGREDGQRLHRDRGPLRVRKRATPLHCGCICVFVSMGFRVGSGHGALRSSRSGRRPITSSRSRTVWTTTTRGR